MNESGPLLTVRDLATHFETGHGILKAVDGVSFDLLKGETLGIVGESGSGKSLTVLSIARLTPGTARLISGEIKFDGIELATVSNREMRNIRGRRIAMIFQDPMTSLNPFLKVSTQLSEITELHLGHTRRQAREHAIEMLKTVGIPDARERIDNYPHQFSGGMLQRATIAMALSCNPELLIADEPTTALDVTVQAQILALIKDLRARRGTSVILVTHDLGVIAGMTDRIIVMYAGKIFEHAPTRELFSKPANPYTVGLLKSIPDPAQDKGSELYQIPGMPPELANLPPGCPFQERCYRAEDICRTEFPPFVQIGPKHQSLCHFANEVYTDAA
jgi:oligopeptide transport system ATP-binding protein